MTRYLIPAILLALIAAFFLSLGPASSGSLAMPANGPRPGPHAGSESPTPETAMNGSRTKSRIRIQHPKPTIEETVKLLKSTIIPKADFQDLTLPEVTAALNACLKEAGIPSHQLKVDISNPELWQQWRIKELRIRNVPLRVLLKYVCGDTKLRCRVEPGFISFYDDSEMTYELPELEKANDPNDLPLDPNNPFTNSPDQTSDPFAEPATPGTH